MVKKIYYEKVGRKYQPIAEYDSDMLDSFLEGDHLVHCRPGGVSRCYNIDPDYAAMIAAGRVAKDAICDAIRQASELRPTRNPITPAQKRAWQQLAEEFGDELLCLNGASAWDIAEAGIKAMQAEADKLMQHKSVRDAYEYFMLMCQLTKEQ